jgi:hypothetical protein
MVKFKIFVNMLENRHGAINIFKMEKQERENVDGKKASATREGLFLGFHQQSLAHTNGLMMA